MQKPLVSNKSIKVKDDTLIKYPVKCSFAGFLSKMLARLLILFYFFCPSVLSASTVHDLLAQIPPKDRTSICMFFEHVIYMTPAPFTLFGDKPMSGIACVTYIHPIYFVESAYYSALRKHYEVWKKYAHLFPSKKYLFVENDHVDVKNLYIMLLNNEAFLNIINEHLPIFQEILGKELDAKQIFNRIVSSSDFYREALNNNQGLYGILFGFGKNNAFRFHDIYSSNIPYQPLTMFNKDEYQPLIRFRIPDFVAVSDDPETIFLEKKYRAQRNAIIEAYLGKDFLEVTLSKFMEN